jgi:hypothetical protein
LLLDSPWNRLSKWRHYSSARVSRVLSLGLRPSTSPSPTAKSSPLASPYSTLHNQAHLWVVVSLDDRHRALISSYICYVDTIEVALDVSADGKLNLPPYGDDSPSQIFNITIFLYSYDTGRNFTITNGTASANNASLGDIMLSESGSTVKHVKWQWPDCLVGDGQPTSSDSDRGVYNVSFRCYWRLFSPDSGEKLYLLNSGVLDLDSPKLPSQRRRSLYHFRRAHQRHQQHRGRGRQAVL